MMKLKKKITTVLPKSAATPREMARAERLLGKGGLVGVRYLLIEDGRIIGGRR